LKVVQNNRLTSFERSKCNRLTSFKVEKESMDNIKEKNLNVIV